MSLILLLLLGFAIVPLAICVFGVVCSILAFPFYLIGRFLNLLGFK